jgi:hypothetical protein
MYPESFPLLDRIEWHLARYKGPTWLINRLIHTPHRWRYRLRRSAMADYEAKVHSQNGEDGILGEIFRRIGTTNRYAIEFGASTGEECCTHHLMADGWSGLLIEGGEGAVELRARWANRRDVLVKQAFIARDNILELLDEAPRDPDLLVVDIDGNDYWILQTILGRFRPRAIVAEYNAHFAPPIEWVMPYDAKHTWNGTAYFGASLAAVAALAAKHEYELVACDSNGVNAFFVRREDLRHFPRNRTVADHYMPMYGSRGFGHPIRSSPSHS